jgi:hypothetical protein
MASNRMEDSASGSASVDEANHFHRLAQKWTPLSDDIKQVRFRFGEASDGSPAIWITVVVPDDLKPSKEKINKLYRATEGLRTDVLKADPSRWPYIDIETE